MVTSVDVFARQRLDALRQHDVRQMQRVLISSAPTSASMNCGMLSAEHSRSMVWVTMLTVPPRFTPGRGFGVLQVQGNADADGRAFAEPHEVDMEREVAHRIEVEVARNHAMLLAVEIDVEDRGEEAAGQDAQAQFAHRRPRSSRGAGCRHRSRRALCRRDALPVRPPCRLRTCGRLQFLDGRHRVKSLFSKKLKAATRPGCTPQQASRGAGAADVAGF